MTELQPTPTPPSPPRLLVVALAAAALLHIGSFAWFVPGNDLTRDLLMALAIADGDVLLRGPGINDALHLGPIWFWMLALLLKLGVGLTGTLLFIGTLATLKVPLAWRLGARLGGPWLALVFAALMLLPGWGVLYAIQLTHTVVLETLLLAAWLSLLSLWRAGAAWHWTVFGLISGLAMHAHPVAALLLLPAAIVAWRRRARWRGDVGWVAAGIALAILPLLPVVLAEWRDGWPALHSLRTAAEKAPLFERSTPLQLAVSMTVGSWQVLHVWLPPAFAWAAGISLVVVVTLAGAALVRRRHDRALRRHLGLALALVPVTLLWLVAVRYRTPFYMAILAWPTMLMVLALPLAAWANAGRGGRIVATLAVAIALAGGGSAALGLMAISRSGHADLPLALIIDIRHLDAPRVRLAVAPIHALDRMANAHCDDGTVHVHGELAALVDFYQSIPFRWNCPGLAVQVMGTDGEHHSAGITPHALRLLGHPNPDWDAAVTLAPRRVIAPAHGVAPVRAYRYPPRDVQSSPAQTHRFAFAAAADEAISVYSPLFPYDGASTPVASCDGVAVAPASWTNAGALFLPPRPGAGCHWEISVESRVADQVDIVTLPLVRR